MHVAGERVWSSVVGVVHIYTHCAASHFFLLPSYIGLVTASGGFDVARVSIHLKPGAMALGMELDSLQHRQRNRGSSCAVRPGRQRWQVWRSEGTTQRSGAGERERPSL